MAANRGSPIGSRSKFLKDLGQGLLRADVSNGSRLLVAFSGGADSTALLLGLKELSDSRDFSLELEAAHFNHGLRDVQSEADEDFCRQLCDSHGIQFHSGRGDVKAHAVENGGSVEAAARDLRYRFLAATAESGEINLIATGHTMDDQAETVLLAMTRGAGLRGISGMDWSTERSDISAQGTPLRVVRPMLGIRRPATEAYCATVKVEPRQDASNKILTYSRNRVRQNVLPELAAINSGVVEAISRLAETGRQDIEFIETIARAELTRARSTDSNTFSREVLRAIAPALLPHVIALAYEESAGTRADLETVSLTAATEAALSLDSGRIDLPHGIGMVVERNLIRFIAREHDPDCPYPPRVDSMSIRPGETVWFADGSRLACSRVSPPPDPASLSRWQSIISLQAADRQQLEIRPRNAGDRFHPFGMNSEMKLQDFMVNRHIPARWRDRVPLVLGSQGICWVAGERIADWAKVHRKASEAILLEYFPANEQNRATDS